MRSSFIHGERRAFAKWTDQNWKHIKQNAPGSPALFLIWLEIVLAFSLSPPLSFFTFGPLFLGGGYLFVGGIFHLLAPLVSERAVLWSQGVGKFGAASGCMENTFQHWWLGLARWFSFFQRIEQYLVFSFHFYKADKQPQGEREVCTPHFSWRPCFYIRRIRGHLHYTVTSVWSYFNNHDYI